MSEIDQLRAQYEKALALIPETATTARDSLREVFERLADALEGAEEEVSKMSDELEEARVDEDAIARNLTLKHADAFRDCLERPMGKLSYQIRDQRGFDKAVLALLGDADINPLAA